MPIVSRLKERREEAGLTQIQLAELSGFHVQTIKTLEAGNVIPVMSTAEKLAIVLGLEIADVFPSDRRPA